MVESNNKKPMSPASQEDTGGGNAPISDELISNNASNDEVYGKLITQALANFSKLQKQRQSEIEPKGDLAPVRSFEGPDCVRQSSNNRDEIRILAENVLRSFHENRGNRSTITSSRGLDSSPVGSVSSPIQVSQQGQDDYGQAYGETLKPAAFPSPINTTLASPKAISLSNNPDDVKPSSLATHATSIFPMKLHELLDDNSPATKSCITWMPDGKMWKVLDTVNLEYNVLNRFFRHCKYTSFNRQVNLWGFTRVVKGNNTGCYYHPLFLRGQRELCLKMKRKQEKHRKQNKSEVKGDRKRSCGQSSPEDNSLTREPEAIQQSLSLDRSKFDNIHRRLDPWLGYAQFLNQHRDKSNSIIRVGTSGVLNPTAPLIEYLQQNLISSDTDQTNRLLLQTRALESQRFQSNGVQPVLSQTDEPNHRHRLSEHLNRDISGSPIDQQASLLTLLQNNLRNNQFATLLQNHHQQFAHYPRFTQQQQEQQQQQQQQQQQLQPFRIPGQFRNSLNQYESDLVQRILASRQTSYQNHSNDVVNQNDRINSLRQLLHTNNNSSDNDDTRLSSLDERHSKEMVLDPKRNKEI